MAATVNLRSIAGLIPVSMIDWDGRLASVIFLSGCNFRCPYCHNPELINVRSPGFLPWTKIEDHLVEKKGWIDGVVVTGGEPTINKDLAELLTRIKQYGLAVKLDTNGSRPDVLAALLDARLVDYVAIDIKSGFETYDAAVMVDGYSDIVREAAHLVVKSGVDHEFRTTVVPGYADIGDTEKLAKLLGGMGGRRYFIQQFNPRSVFDAALTKLKPFPAAALEAAAESCRFHLPTKVRGAN